MNPETPNTRSSELTRRDLLRRAGTVGAGTVVTAFGVGVVAEAATTKKKAASKKATKTTPITTTKPSAKTTPKTTAKPSAKALASGTCTLTPETTEGPFYLDLNKVRADITEGRPGAPLELNLVVNDAKKCAPIAGAAVDIWHTDALGTYSGVEGDSGTFMRGTQVSDANGAVKFTTVYPGWYQGRTVHIHVMVHVAGNIVHTGQIYFDDAVTDAVYKSDPYDTRGVRTTRNNNDSIFARQGGADTVVAPAKAAKGYGATLTMSVRQ
jgi:protocatechuate 3,4-dioxygenase beta subunit